MGSIPRGEGYVLTLDLSTVVPTSLAAVDSLDKIRFMFLVGHLWLSLQGTDTAGEGWRLAICFDCSVSNWYRGLVDCGTNSLQLLTLWKKTRFRFILGHLGLLLQGTDTWAEGWHLTIWFDCSVLNWNCGLVDCGTNILRGCWLFGQNKIQVYCGASLTIVGGNRHRGRRVTSCQLIWFLSIKLGPWSCWLWYQHPLQLLILWTKQDSGLLRGIFEYCCGE
jgi:hypothetical protein